MCCTGHSADASTPISTTLSFKDRADALLKGIHDGTIKGIDSDMYLQLAQTLFGDFKANFDVPDEAFLYTVQNNLYAFSGAKSMAMYKQLRDLVTDGGRVRSFAEFKREALQVVDNYNLTWLATERQNVIRSGIMSSEWQRNVQAASVYPYLKYRTEADNNVRPEHAALEGIVRKVSDGFWDNFYPPNGWNCRCYTEQLTEADVTGTITTDEAVSVAAKNAKVADGFKVNPGKSGVVFSDAHDYFQSLPKGKQLKASDYGLPKAEDITGGTPVQFVSKEEFETWFNEQLNGGETFELKPPAALNITPKVPKALAGKIVKQNRYAYGKELKAVIEKPDEVWSGYVEGAKFAKRWVTAYIKYYKGQLPIAVLVDAEGTVLSIQQAYNWARVNQWRINILLYRK
jgi:SPP1 gp7 family putative phage head morphogenesis protein